MQRPFCPKRLKKLCICTASLAVRMRIAVQMQSFLLVDYPRLLWGICMQICHSLETASLISLGHLKDSNAAAHSVDTGIS